MKTQIKSKSSKIVVECLLCYKEINLGVDPKINKFVTCKNCENVFEIINLHPIMIDWPYYDDYDYDDIDDD